MSQNIVTQGKEWKTGHAGIQEQSYLKLFLTFMQYIVISMIKEHFSCIDCDHGASQNKQEDQ